MMRITGNSVISTRDTMQASVIWPAVKLLKCTFSVKGNLIEDVH